MQRGSRLISEGGSLEHCHLVHVLAEVKCSSQSANAGAYNDNIDYVGTGSYSCSVLVNTIKAWIHNRRDDIYIKWRQYCVRNRW